jgi:hypothetical protein
MPPAEPGDESCKSQVIPIQIRILINPAWTLEMIRASMDVTVQNNTRDATVSIGGCRKPREVAYSRKTAEMTVNKAQLESAILNVLSTHVIGAATVVAFERGQPDIQCFFLLFLISVCAFTRYS